MYAFKDCPRCDLPLQTRCIPGSYEWRECPGIDCSFSCAPVPNPRDEAFRLRTQIGAKLNEILAGTGPLGDFGSSVALKAANARTSAKVLATVQSLQVLLQHVGSCASMGEVRQCDARFFAALAPEPTQCDVAGREPIINKARTASLAFVQTGMARQRRSRRNGDPERGGRATFFRQWAHQSEVFRIMHAESRAACR